LGITQTELDYRDAVRSLRVVAQIFGDFGLGTLRSVTPMVATGVARRRFAA
jgi:hypothetical protein